MADEEDRKKRARINGKTSDDAVITDGDPDPATPEPSQQGAASSSQQGDQNGASLQEEAEPIPTIEGVDDTGELSQEPDPISVSGSNSELFPGLSCVLAARLTVRKVEKYINMYGPRECPWFVIESSSGSEDADRDYQEASVSTERKIDRPLKAKDRGQKIKLSDIAGVQYLACNVDLETQGDPLAMAEALNPRVVKLSETYKDSKARRDAVRKPDTKIRQYPSTYLLVQFNKNVWDVKEGQEAGLGPFAPNRSWELSSAFKALHGSSKQFRTEEVIYSVAVSRANRFLQWYAMEHPDGFDKWHKDHGEPDISPLQKLPSRSATPVSKPKQATPNKSRDATPASATESTVTNNNPSTTVDDKSTEGDLSPEEREEITEQWRRRYIKYKGDLTQKDKERLERYIQREMTLHQ